MALFLVLLKKKAGEIDLIGCAGGSAQLVGVWSAKDGLNSRPIDTVPYIRYGGGLAVPDSINACSAVEVFFSAERLCGHGRGRAAGRVSPYRNVQVHPFQ